MCGLYGFLGYKGRGANAGTLCNLALDMQRRGEHAFGMAWVDKAGRTQMYKQPGAVGDDLWLVEEMDGAAAVIGHTRYATQGDPADNTNNHPHPVDGGWLAHNGVISNYADMIISNRLNPVGHCDSEAIALIAAKTAGSLLDRIVAGVEAVNDSAAVVALWAKPARLVIARKGGKPLWVSVAQEGMYFASEPRELPGQPRMMADNTACLLKPAKAGGFERQTVKLAGTFYSSYRRYE